MSTIDKSLPNVEQEIKLPSEEEVVEASQENIEEQVGPEDIATNPFNYLYPAFADQTPKLTRGLSPTLRKVARLGLSGPALRILSRAGIGGFAASAAIQGLGLLDD